MAENRVLVRQLFHCDPGKFAVDALTEVYLGFM